MEFIKYIISCFKIYYPVMLSKYYFSFLVVYAFTAEGRAIEFNLSRLMGKPTICICQNKEADQLRGNREADQRLCFH